MAFATGCRDFPVCATAPLRVRRIRGNGPPETKIAMPRYTTVAVESVRSGGCGGSCGTMVCRSRCLPCS